MATHRINFTKTSIEAIKPPAKPANAKGGVYNTYYDIGEKGLILIVSNGGSKTFYLYTKITGKPERLKLGKHPDMSVEKARKAAIEARGKIAGGKNPKEEKDRIKQDMRFADFFEQHFMKRYSEPYKKSYKYDLEQYRLHLTPLKDKKLLNITRADIEKLHSDIGKRGIYAANHALALVKVVFNKAIEWGWEGNSPAAAVRKFKQKSRERFLMPEELPRFFHALDQEHNMDMKDYFYICLLTGARKSNVMAMRWQDISFSRNTWTIEETKNGESHTVNIMAEVVAILRKREKIKKDEWVFSSDSSKSGHMEEPKAAWRRILMRTELFHLIELIGTAQKWKPEKIAQAITDVEQESLTALLKQYRTEAKQLKINMDGVGIKNLRIHDLRRTLGSWQAITGANPFVRRLDLKLCKKEL